MAGKAVVVVHPDPAHGCAITEVCRASGFDVIAFTDPIDALSHIERSAIDALVTAVRFARGALHGIALALMARYRHTGLKVLLIAEPRDQAEAQRVARCVPAPGDPASVADMLHHLIRSGGTAV